MSWADLVADLVRDWRAKAYLFREHAHQATAIAYETCAEQLESELHTLSQEHLTLAGAALLGGYSEDHLGRMVREGRIPNAGRRGAPRIRRADVPIKPNGVACAPSRAQVDREQIVRSVIDEGVG